MLRKQPHRILVDDSLLGNPIGVPSGAGSTIQVPGYGELVQANIVHSYKECDTAETPQVDNVEVVIPTSCECPYEWSLRIVCKPDLGLYETQTTFPAERNYTYEDPAGGTPTAVAAANSIVDSINADPYSCVTAVHATDIAGTPDPNTGTVLATGIFIHITANAGTNGFETYTNSGNITLVTPFAPAILSIADMRRLFPIQHGSFGQANPAIPSASGSYCAYHFRLRRAGDLQDDSLADGYMDYEQEVIFYADQNATNYANFNGAAVDEGVSGIIPQANGGDCTGC